MARLRLISREEMAPDKQPIYDRIAATRGSVANVFKVLLNSPDAAAAIGGLGKYLRFSSSLDPAIREVCILSTAKELDNGYEWANHEPEARRVGVRDETIESIRNGRASMGIPAKEGVVAQAAKELVRDGTLTERTFQAIEHLLGPEQTVDLIVLVGYYSLVSRVVKALDVEMDHGVQAEPPS